MKSTVLCAALLSSMILAAKADISHKIQESIDPVVQQMAQKYNCSISVAIKGPFPLANGESPLSVVSAAGVIDRSSGAAASTTDKYVWGSITKMVTGAGVLSLVDKNIISLDDTVTQYIDPFIQKMAKSDPSQNFTSMADLWGPEVSKITVMDLLHMTSGVPDFDTASPSGRQPTDSFRAQVYANPGQCYSPSMLLSVPWCATGKLLFTPGKCDRMHYGNCYSSSNFVLLGLLLAHHSGASDWQSYDQHECFGPAKEDFSGVVFATNGPPTKYTSVRGYDTTHYNHNTGAIDVSNACGVFGGWSASDFVADSAEAATLGQDLYGPKYKLVSKPLVDQMYETSGYTGYGLATFNLTRLTPHDIAYGHLGATYGYQSIVVFAPGLNISIAIGTNIERDEQDQPQDVFCTVYNYAKAVILGKPLPTCTYKRGYWNGGCKCE